MSKNKRNISSEEYNQAMKEMDERSGNPMSAVYLFMALSTFGIILYLLEENIFQLENTLPSIASKVIIPYAIISFIIWLFFFLKVIGIFLSFRCPRCRKFFPIDKSKLELYTSVEGTSLGIDSGGDYYLRSSTSRAYWTECKHCGHVMWVTKGG